MKRYLKVFATLPSIFALVLLVNMALVRTNVSATSKASLVVKNLNGAVRGIINGDTSHLPVCQRAPVLLLGNPRRLSADLSKAD